MSAIRDNNAHYDAKDLYTNVHRMQVSSPLLRGLEKEKTLYMKDPLSKSILTTKPMH